MQLVKTQRDNLLRPLQTVSGIVERRHTLPILANLLIRKTGQDISFLSTDLELQITTRADCGAGASDVATTVAARKLLDILRNVPDSEVSLSLSDKRLTVQAGKSRFALQTLAAEDFPTVTEAKDYGASFELPQKTFRQLLAMVHFAMAQQDIRYYLNGLLLVVAGDMLRMVATDGHRLAYAASPLVGDYARTDVILPRKTVVELARQLADSDDALEVTIVGNQIVFRFGHIELISKLIDGKFPDYERVIPQGHPKLVKASRLALLQSLQRAAILTNEKFRGVRLMLSEGSLKLVSTNAEQEEAQEELEVDYSGDALDIGFNVTYLLDVLNNLSANEIEIRFNDGNASALFGLADDPDFKYVVMPMRI